MKKKIIGKDMGKKDKELREKIDLLWTDHQNHKDERFEKQIQIPDPLDKYIEEVPVFGGDCTEPGKPSAAIHEMPITNDLKKVIDNMNKDEVPACLTFNATNRASMNQNNPKNINVFDTYKNILNNLQNLIKHFIENQNLDEVSMLTNFAITIKELINKEIKIIREKDHSWETREPKVVEDVLYNGKFTTLSSKSRIDDLIERLDKFGYLNTLKPAKKKVKKKTKKTKVKAKTSKRKTN